MDTQRGRANVNGTLLDYEIAGAGDAVVFIHGFAADARVWNAQFGVFAEHYRVLRYDLRGHGKSELPTAEPYTHADDLRALLDFVEISRAHLIGQSMGGEIAINFALAYPGCVQSLVLVDAAIGGYEWSEEWWASWQPIFAAANSQGVKAAVELVMQHPIFVSIAENAEARRQLVQIFDDYTGWHWLNADPVIYPDPPAVSRLGEIQMPALVIIAERDMADFHTMAATLCRQLPHATRLDLPGTGHVVPMEAPAQFNEAALEFLAQQ